MNAATIEAIYRRDLERAKDTYDALVEAAEKERQKQLTKLEERRREDYRYEQEFFYQG